MWHADQRVAQRRSNRDDTWQTDLVVREPLEREARFGFLETIRGYVGLTLLASKEAAEARDRLRLAFG